MVTSVEANPRTRDAEIDDDDAFFTVARTSESPNPYSHAPRSTLSPLPEVLLPINPTYPVAALEMLRAYDLDAFAEMVAKVGSVMRKLLKQCKDYHERSKGEISFWNFAKGDLALFLPTRNLQSNLGTRSMVRSSPVWMPVKVLVVADALFL